MEGEGRENVKLKGVKSVLINLNISFKHFIMSWQKRCVHGKLKKCRESSIFRCDNVFHSIIKA